MISSINTRWSTGAFRLLVMCMAGFCVALNASAQAVDNSTYNKVQAAYIYKIANFVSWPTGLDSEHFNICILESNGNLASFIRDAIGNRTVNQLPVVVAQISAEYLLSSTDLPPCHLVYLLQPLTAEIIHSVNHNSSNRPVLWVTAPEVDGRGTVLFELVREGARMLIYVNREQLDSSELLVESALLSVARPR